MLVFAVSDYCYIRSVPCTAGHLKTNYWRYKMTPIPRTQLANLQVAGGQNKHICSGKNACSVSVPIHIFK